MTDTLILSTGRGTFDLLNPRAEDVNVDDMLRNLSRIVRFCGASPFTVLQHSLYVGRLLRSQGHSRDLILAGFTHDLHEYTLPATFPRRFLTGWCMFTGGGATTKSWLKLV